MLGESWTIYWNEYCSSTYLYGSTVTFYAKDDVEFENALMPPGTVIKRWYSRTNYQMQRIEPTLPLIDGEGAYSITLSAAANIEGGLCLRLVFFDRYGEEAGSQVVRDHTAEFRCPIKTYSYEVQLIGAGASSVRFHSITISELIEI